MAFVLNVMTVLMFAVGGVLIFIGGIGTLRMPDLYSRILPAGITDSIGTLLVLGGCLLQAGFTLAAVKLAAILLFLLLTSPTAAYALANAARLANVAPVPTPRNEEEKR